MVSRAEKPIQKTKIPRNILPLVEQDRYQSDLTLFALKSRTSYPVSHKGRDFFPPT